MRPFSQKEPFARRDIIIQGHSVRRIGASEEPVDAGERKPLRRDPPSKPVADAATDDPLRLRLAEELDYARRMLKGLEDVLANDPVLIVRHVHQMQSLDIVSQMLGHISSVIRASDQATAVEKIGMAELKARLMRRRIG